MESRQTNVVHGYVRQHFEELFPVDVVKIIYGYYLLHITSKILSSDEQISLLNLLWDRLKTHKENKNVNSFDTQLLYRASDNEYSAQKFYELCSNKGANITIIHTEYDHIFGVYTSKSWGGRRTDQNAFVFLIRPKVKIYEFKSDKKDGEGAIWNAGRHYGPIFGSGGDIWIVDKCNVSTGNGCHNKFHASFDFDPEELSGAKLNETWQEYSFKVMDYETFAIDILK